MATVEVFYPASTRVSGFVFAEYEMKVDTAKKKQFSDVNTHMKFILTYKRR
jgi:hypothetical protein